MDIDRLTPNDPYMGRTAPLTSKRYILYNYSTNIGTEYLEHSLYSPFSSLQSAVYLIMLTCFVPGLFTFYIQGVLKLKKNNSGAKGLKETITNRLMVFERKILRKIFGPTYENGSWRIKTNQELDEIIKRKKIINFARAQRLGWYGYIESMQETRMVNCQQTTISIYLS
jgi:hypothetical protein